MNTIFQLIHRLHPLLGFVFLCVATMTVSCSDSGVPEDFVPSLVERTVTRSLSIEKTKFTYTSVGGDQNAMITAENTTWKLADFPSWISASTREGSSSRSVTFHVQENTSVGKSRTAISRLTSTDAGPTINIPLTFTQAAVPASISVDTPSLTLSASATTRSINVTSNVSWSALCTASWIKITKSTSSLQLSIEENTKANVEREAMISLVDVSTDKELATISVVQRAYSKITIPESINFTSSGGSMQFDVKSDVAWTLYTSSSWLSASPASGTSGTKTVTISATPNSEYVSRTAYVYIRVAGQNAAELTVIQNSAQENNEQSISSVNASGASFSSTGGSLTLSFYTYGGWRITKQTSASWLTLSRSSGTSNGYTTLTVTAADNASVSPRYGSIFITPENGNVYEVTYSQSGKYLNLSTTSDITMFAKGGATNYINVTTDGSWSVASSVSWITITRYSSSFVVNVSKNVSDSDRSGVVTVELTGLTDSNRYTKTITVKQLAQGELYTNGYTSGTPTSGAAFRIDLTGYGSDVNWDGQLSGTK